MQDTVLREKKALPIGIGDLLGQIHAEYTLSGLDADLVIDTIVTSDNGSILQGCFFIPWLETDEEIRKVHAAGAAAVLTDHAVDGVPCVVVQDYVKTLRDICCWMNEKIALPSIIVVGSEGKTTTKRMVAAVMRQKCRTFCQYHNYNTLHALCTSLQEIRPDDRFVVQEVDEKRENSIRYCSETLKPEVAIVTNIAEAHIGHLGGLEGLFAAFRNVAASMGSTGAVLICADNENSLQVDFGRTTLSVGIYNRDADCVADHIVTNETGGTEFDVTFRGETAHLSLNVLGEHNVYDAMFAFVAGKLNGISTEQIRAGLLNYKNTGFRQNICSLGGYTVYADCYNASLTSVRFALKSFAAIRCTGKKAAVLGDIAELEGFEESTYTGIAQAANEAGIDAVIAYGKDSAMLLEHLQDGIVKKHAADSDTLDRMIAQMKKEGYTCWLFKASRFMKLEKNIAASFPQIYRTIMEQDTHSGGLKNRIKRVLKRILRR